MVKRPFERDYVEKTLLEVARKLSTPLEVYLIGGCALSLRNIKSVTFDVDVVVKDEAAHQVFTRALRDAGFESPTSLSSEHRALYAQDQYENKDGLHFDIFVNRVANMLVLSDGMVKRSQSYFGSKFGNLHLFLISPEDIFLFKGFASTGRTRDLDDMQLLMHGHLNWADIEHECLEQAMRTGKKDPARWLSIFINRLEELEKTKDLQVPIRRRLTRTYLALCEKQENTISTRSPGGVQPLY